MKLLFEAWVLAGANQFADPFVAAVTIFLLAALVGAKMFSETSSQNASARLSLLVGLSGAATLGAIVVAGGAGSLFSRAAGVLAVALSTAAAVGGFLMNRTLLSRAEPDTSQTTPVDVTSAES